MKPSTCGYRCQARGRVGRVPFSGFAGFRTPRTSIVAFLLVSGGPVGSWRGGHQYAPESASTHVHVPRPAAIATMHRRREDIWIEERSSATGRRKATFTGAGPQVTMLLSFQRSTQVRTRCASFVPCRSQPALSSAAVSRKEAVVAFPAKPAIRIVVMDCFPHGGFQQSAWVEAELELEQRVSGAAYALAKVKTRVAVVARPAGGLEEQEVIGTAAPLGRT
jgi:hypothetical protein